MSERPTLKEELDRAGKAYHAANAENARLRKEIELQRLLLEQKDAELKLAKEEINRMNMLANEVLMDRIEERDQKIKALKAEKESWGNEFTAVMILRDEVENLKQQLDFAIEVAQMRGAAACDSVEKIKELEAEVQTFGAAWNELETLQTLLRKARKVLVPYSKMQGRSLNKNAAEEIIERIDEALGEKK